MWLKCVLAEPIRFVSAAYTNTLFDRHSSIHLLIGCYYLISSYSIKSEISNME